MQKWLDSAVALLQRTSSGIDPDNHSDCLLELDEILDQEKSFTAGLDQLKTLNLLLVDFMETEEMSNLRHKVETVRLRDTDVKQQLDAHREVLQRCVLKYPYISLF